VYATAALDKTYLSYLDDGDTTSDGEEYNCKFYDIRLLH
jgi:hypothetical protein